jgi:hypothetical protein
MHSNKVHRIIFYGTKRQRRTYFRAQSCDFCVIFWFLSFDCNRAQSGSSRGNVSLKTRICSQTKRPESSGKLISNNITENN